MLQLMLQFFELESLVKRVLKRERENIDCMKNDQLSFSN